LSVTCDRSVDFSGYSNFRHKSSSWNIFKSGVKHLTSNGQMMDQKFVYVVHNIKHIWVIMWHIFTSTNDTTTNCFPHNSGNCYTHTMSLNNVLKKKQLHFQYFLLTIKLNYLHDLKIMLQCLLHLNMYM
jgi:hypothetical protein